MWLSWIFVIHDVVRGGGEFASHTFCFIPFFKNHWIICPFWRQLQLVQIYMYGMISNIFWWSYHWKRFSRLEISWFRPRFHPKMGVSKYVNLHMDTWWDFWTKLLVGSVERNIEVTRVSDSCKTYLNILESRIPWRINS